MKSALMARARSQAQCLLLASVLLFFTGISATAQSAAPLPKLNWKTVEFAIVKFNDQAPNAWNIYHTDKKGVLLVHFSKRYLLVKVEDEEVYDIDPQTVIGQGDVVQWSYSNLPPKPLNTPEWTDRNVGRLQRIRFRLSKTGHFLELQLPVDPVGNPLY